MCGTCYILANIIVKKYKKGNSQVQRECLEEMTGMTGNERGRQIFKRQKMDGGKKMEDQKARKYKTRAHSGGGMSKKTKQKQKLQLQDNLPDSKT